MSSKLLQKLLNFWNKETQIVFFILRNFEFVIVIYVDIDQGIQGKLLEMKPKKKLDFEAFL